MQAIDNSEELKDVCSKNDHIRMDMALIHDYQEKHYELTALNDFIKNELEEYLMSLIGPVQAAFDIDEERTITSFSSVENMAIQRETYRERTYAKMKRLKRDIEVYKRAIDTLSPEERVIFHHISFLNSALLQSPSEQSVIRKIAKALDQRKLEELPDEYKEKLSRSLLYGRREKAN